MNIEFGAFAKPLSKQLAKMIADRKDLKMFDRMADAVTMCAVHGLISENEIASARKKIIKKIEARLK